MSDLRDLVKKLREKARELSGIGDELDAKGQDSKFADEAARIYLEVADELEALAEAIPLLDPHNPKWGGERCQRCLQDSHIGFSVPDEVWRAVTGLGENGVWCIGCFTRVAEREGIEWGPIEFYPVCKQGFTRECELVDALVTLVKPQRVFEELAAYIGSRSGMMISTGLVKFFGRRHDARELLARHKRERGE